MRMPNGQESVLFESYRPPNPFKKLILFLIALLIIILAVLKLLGRI